MEKANVDPELLKQLDAAAAAAEPVSAVFSLRPGREQKFVPAEEVEARVHGLLDKIGKEVGTAADQVHVFRNLGAFAVSAPAPFLRKLLERHEIASATANRQPQDLLIRPVRSKPVRPPDERRENG